MPGSTTYRMPGTVSEVSATLVASTIRRPVCGCEDPVLLGGRQPGVERQDLGARGRLLLAQRVGGVADLALAGEEDQDVARPLARDSSSTASQIAVIWSRSLGPSPVVRVDERAVADLDRVGAAGDLDDRRVVEVLGEPLRVDGRRGDDDLEVGPAGQQLLEVAEEEVDVEAALVRLVDDDRVVRAQHPVALDLGQQDAVGHQLDQRVVADLVGEADLVADRARRARCRSSSAIALGDGAGGDPARLGVADHARARRGRAPGRSSGSWVVLPEPVSPATITTWWSRIAASDVVPALADRQLVRVRDRRARRPARGDPLLGGVDVRGDLRRRSPGCSARCGRRRAGVATGAGHGHQLGQASLQIGERFHGVPRIGGAVL